MFKPYFTHKGQRMGWHNPVKTRKGEESFMWWYSWRATVFIGVLIGLNASAYKTYVQTNSPVWLFITITLCVTWLTYFIYFMLQCDKSKCRFCSTSREEAERFVSQKCTEYNLPADSHEIVLDDGWYMVYYTRKPTKP